jgi:glutathione synthase/RimK-type ligase-like ATP-grasp enzyme
METTKLHFLIERRDGGTSPLVAEVAEVLERRGFEVETSVLEDELVRSDLLDGGDRLWLLESCTELSLATAAVFHARGARILNPYSATIAARNKIVASRILASACLPAPRTWTTGDVGLVRALLREHAVIVKPYMERRGGAAAVVRDERDLAALPPPTAPVVVQELLPGGGADLRVHVAGSELFATRRPSSDPTLSPLDRPVPVTPELRSLAVRCGEAFGLALYAVDVVETPRGAHVVDVIPFPGYEGWEGAEEAVASAIEQYATGERDLARLAGPGAPRRGPNVLELVAAGLLR